MLNDRFVTEYCGPFSGGTDEKDDDDGKASSKPFLQDNLGQRMS